MQNKYLILILNMAVFLSVLSASLNATPCLLRNGDRIVILGDSITEQGDQLPSGYVKILRAMISAKEIQAQVIAAGVSGDKVIDLKRRLDADILTVKPSTVIVFIGVNDILHQKYFPLRESSPENFYNIYKEILSKIHSTGAKMIICTLACIGEKTAWTQQDWEPRRNYWPWKRSPQYGDGQLSLMLDQYSDIIRQLAVEFDVTVVDLQKEFKNYLMLHNKNNAYSGILTKDGVHLNDKGNQFVASLIAYGLDLPACY